MALVSDRSCGYRYWPRVAPELSTDVGGLLFHLINRPNRDPIERPVAVTQRSSARYRHWPFRC